MGCPEIPEGLSTADLEVIETQLERKVDNCIGVARRCTHGFPQVVKSYPIKNGEPFPTLYWLSCPYLFSAIGRLEEKGLIPEWEKEIEENEDLKNEMQYAHKEEISKRLALIGKEIEKLPEGMQKKLKETGIGGLSDFSKIKCLHLHFASFCGGTKNPIGERVFNKLFSLVCEDIRCKK